MTDWIVLFALLGAYGSCSAMIGMRLEKWRRDKEVDAWEIPIERLQDGAYWKRRYEDVVNDLDEVVGPKSFGEEQDARRETT